MSGRPRRACDKCSAQKLRCSGTRPRCQRCHRLRRPCIYRDATQTDALEAESRVLPGISALEPSLSEVTNLSIPASLPQKSYIGVPRALIPKLLDVYFSHIYNANLLVRKPALLKAVAAEAVRDDMLLSICAFAAKFYREDNGRLPLLENGFAYEWAERAGRLAFQEAEFPKEENVVSFMNLALFWYSEGEFRRCNMHQGTAIHTTRVLGMSVEGRVRDDALQGEMRRRRFWATYLTSTFQSEDLATPSETMMKLSLPCRDDQFDTSLPRDRISLQSGQRNDSVYAELIRVMTLWSAVQVLVKQSEPNDGSRLAAIQALDGRVRGWWVNLPPALHLNPLDFYSAPSATLPCILLIHTVYHQCLCSLHSSIVPLFSWSAGDDNCHYAWQISGQTAFDNANALSVLFESALNHPWDPSRMPSFIGYAAYCACAIQIPFMWCLNSVVKKKARHNVLTNLRTINIVGKYWKFVELLGSNVRLLYEFHAKHPRPIADEPRNIDAAAMAGFGPKAPKARVSILTHNLILWAQDGGVARRTDEVDIGLEDGNPDSTAGGGGGGSAEGRIDDLFSEISREGQDGSENPLFMDVFPLHPNFGPNELSWAFDQMNNQMHVNQTGSIEDWIGELMQENL